jgi:hypothetical protein
MSAHSYIWQGWVWHGLLGGLFWIIVLILLIRYLGQGIHLCRPLIAANAVLVLMGCWNILFSPFSERSLWGARFVVMVMTFAEIERRKYLNRNGIFVDKDAPWDGKARRAVLAWDG